MVKMFDNPNLSRPTGHLVTCTLVKMDNNNDTLTMTHDVSIIRNVLK